MLIRSERNRCAFIKSSPLSAAFCCIRVSFPISITGRTLMIPDAAAKPLTFFVVLVFFFSPQLRNLKKPRKWQRSLGKWTPIKERRSPRRARKRAKVPKRGKEMKRKREQRRRVKKVTRRHPRKKAVKGKGRNPERRETRGRKERKEAKEGLKGEPRKPKNELCKKSFHIFHCEHFALFFFKEICIILYLKMNKNLIYDKVHCVCALESWKSQEYQSTVKSYIYCYLFTIHWWTLETRKKKKKHPLFLSQVYTDIYSVPTSLYSDEKMRWDFSQTLPTDRI